MQPAMRIAGSKVLDAHRASFVSSSRPSTWTSEFVKVDPEDVSPMAVSVLMEVPCKSNSESINCTWLEAEAPRTCNPTPPGFARSVPSTVSWSSPEPLRVTPEPLAFSRAFVTFSVPDVCRMAASNREMRLSSMDTAWRAMRPRLPGASCPMSKLLRRVNPEADSATSMASPVGASIRIPSNMAAPPFTTIPGMRVSAVLREALSAAIPELAPKRVTSLETIRGMESKAPASTSMVCPGSALSNAG